MKSEKHSESRWNWLWILLIEWLILALLASLVALSYWLGGTFHGILFWCLMPAAGFAAAYFSTVKGLLNYAAWLAPPVMMAGMHYVFWGFMPSVAPVFFCGFISLVGAATGEVVKRQRK